MSNKTNNNKVAIFATFMMVFLTSSFVICNDIWSSAVTIGLWMMLLFCLLYWSHYVDMKLLLVTVLLVTCMGVNTVINGENFRTYIVLAFSYFVALIFASQISLEEFKSAYIDVMKWLCIISLVGFIGYILVPQLQSLFTVINRAGHPFSNLVLYVNAPKQLRNMGMFWEPGAFQTFINLALLFEITCEQPRIKNIIIFGITVLTTYSTTGYIAFIFLMLLLYTIKGKSRNLKIIMTVILALGAVYVYFNFNLFFGSNLANGQSTVFGKILNYFNNASDNTTLSSADVRFNSIFEVIRVFFEKPILGYGYQGLINRTYVYTHGMNTCTFINWFATYGLIFGTVAIAGIIKFSNSLVEGALSRVVVFMTIFIITISENYVNNSFFILIILYGFMQKNSNSCKYKVSEGYAYSRNK